MCYSRVTLLRVYLKLYDANYRGDIFVSLVLDRDRQFNFESIIDFIFAFEIFIIYLNFLFFFLFSLITSSRNGLNDTSNTYNNFVTNDRIIVWFRSNFSNSIQDTRSLQTQGSRYTRYK